MEVEAKDQGGDCEGCEDSVIEGEDAQDSACVELAKEGGVGERVVEDSGDEEAGKDEEQIDTIGTEGQGVVDSPLKSRVWSGREQMGACNSEDSEAADAIQGRDMPREGACFGR